MEIFKLFESTIANIQPDHPSTKDLRRDELLNNYDEATKTLQTLIRAKQNEITYRRDLIEMLEKSKTTYDNQLTRAKQAYQTAKKHAPDTLDLRGTNKKNDSNATSSTTPPITITTTTPSVSPVAASSQQSFPRGTDLDIPLPSESVDNRTSLDRRLSEFLKTFPNLTQAGLSPTPNNNNIKPLPGYYTQQPPPPPPISATPPLMAMLRFPPPPLVPLNPQQNINPANQENHDTADMELSDHDESSNNGGIIPMVASAMQQGAGGKQHLRSDLQQSYVTGQQYNNPVTQYTPRLNPLPFDPSIMDSRLSRESPSSSSSSRDKHSHSERSSHRHVNSGGSSGGGSVKHGSGEKSKYSSSSSSHSSSRSKRR